MTVEYMLHWARDPAPADRNDAGDCVNFLKDGNRGVLWVAIVLCAAGGWIESASARQRRTAGPDRKRAAQRSPRDQHQKRGRPERGDQRRTRDGQRPERGDRFGPGHHFGPTQEDNRPIEDGEAEDLVAFAAEHFPRMHQLLLRIRNADPKKFRQQLQRFAPRLRFMQRLQNDDPQLARIMISLTENEHRLWGYRRRSRGADPQTRRRIKQAARELIDKSIELEGRIMQLRIEKLSESRNEVVEQRFERLSGEDANLAAEPATLRDLIEAARQATEEERPALEVQIRTSISSAIDDELAAIRARLDRRRQNRAEEVDRRLRRLFSHSERPRPKRP